MLLATREQDDEDDCEISQQDQLSYDQLEEWHQDDWNFLGWRNDSSIDEEYYDGNQFSSQDRSEMAAAGVPMITNNRVARQVNDVIGLQSSQLTDWMLKNETVGQDDMLMAMGAKLKTTARLTKANRMRLKAFGSQIKAGIGWIEVGREPNPFRFPHRVDLVPWREMWWDWRATKADLSDANRLRRVKWYRKEILQAAFKEHAIAIEYIRTKGDLNQQFIEPQQMYRSYQGQSWRDPPLTWNLTSNMHKDMRCLEEVWYPVQIAGPVVFLPNGRNIAYQQCCENPMVKLALKSGMARIEDAEYVRWRQSFWVASLKLADRWSTMPFEGPPYIPFWGYREQMTGVPYGLIRILRSLQDTVNTLEGKMQFSMSAVRVKVREGATDLVELRRNVGNKRAMIVIAKDAEMNDVDIDEHLALNEQHYKLYADTKQSMDEVTGTSGLNPASMSEGKPRSAAQVQALALRAMATLGEIQDNYQEASETLGAKLCDLVREDVEKRGCVPVQIKKPTGEKKTVILHQEVGEHDDCKVISNDVTIFHAQVVLDDVPHTATFRAQQFEKIADVLQTMPPEAVDIRRIMLPELVEVSDLPHAEETAQHLRETTGMVPPQTPQAQQAAQQQAQQQAEEREIAKQTALSQIARHNAQAQKLGADAELKRAQAQKTEAELQSGQAQDDALLKREQHATKVTNIRAKTAKTLAETQAIQQQKPQIPTQW